VPPLPVIANNYQVAQQWTTSPELHDMYNVICVEASGSPSVFEVAEQVGHAFASAIAPVVRHAILTGQVSVTPLDGVSARTSWVTPDFGTAGGVTAGNGLPLELAKVLTLRSGLRGRSKRGRLYIPGASDSEVTNEFTRDLTSGAKSALNTAATNFETAMTDGTYCNLALMVLSRTLGLSTLVTQVVANLGLCNQRRRYEMVAHH
jgi:hypothetical protein